MTRRIAVAFIVAGALAAAVPLVPGPAAAAGARAPDVERVLVLSVPHVAWSDLGQGDTPHLDALLDESAIAGLAVRGVRRKTLPGEGYATIGAGTRAAAPRNVDGIALAPDEEFEGGSAAEAFARRTGRSLGAAAAGHLSLAAYRRTQDRFYFGGVLGELGDALADAGIARAVIANADLSADGEPPRYGRQAVAALMGSDGRLPAGRVDRGLLRLDPEAPYGVRLDPGAVTGAFAGVWRDRAVVLVEASDLIRVEAYAASVSRARFTALQRTALRWTDELVGQLLAHVDRSRDAVFVVGPTSPQFVARLTLAGLAAPGHPGGGLLRSASTRRAGLVILADVAPTVLDLYGLPRPSSMEGRPAEWGAAGGAAGERRESLIRTDADARFRDALIFPVWVAFVVAQVVLCGVAVLVLRQRRSRSPARSALEIAALSLLCVLPLTFLARLLPFPDWGKAAYWAFLAAGGVALGTGAWALGLARRPGRSGSHRDLLPVGAVLAAVFGVIVVSAVTGSSLQLNTVFGDSPIVAGRFYGINNVSFAQVITAAFLLAALVAHRWPGRRGVYAALAVVGGTLVVLGLPDWGADVGGVLATAPAFVVIASLYFGLRVGLRTAVMGVAGTAVAIAVFAAADMARPASDRTHLGRLVEDVSADGLTALVTVVERKLDANLSILTRSPWTLMVPVVLAFVAYLVYRSPSSLGEIQRRVPQLRAALAGLLVAGVLGFALNDSGVAVPGMMLAVLNPPLVYLAARWT